MRREVGVVRRCVVRREVWCSEKEWRCGSEKVWCGEKGGGVYFYINCTQLC